MNKNILITGAAGNLGRVVTQFFLDKGYNVIAVIAHKDPPDFLKDSSLDVYQADLTNESVVTELFNQVKEKQKDVESAVFLVGGFAMGNISSTSLAEIEEMMSLNFKTAYNTSRAFINSFASESQEPHRIVLVGARPAIDPAAGQQMVAYSLSKSLIFRLSELINASDSDNNVHSSVIVPSIIDTPANRDAMPDANFADWVKPDDIAEAIGFLLSEAGASVKEGILKLYNKA
jgi:NAD(P)-dependent dehydrogenase (short-subunit alcohol dehydrogenase family)